MTDRVHIMADHIERAGRAGYRRVSLAIQRRSGSTVIHDRDLNKHKERESGLPTLSFCHN